jgi:uncharacterized repeat protein (TIGR01451 family)
MTAFGRSKPRNTERRRRRGLATLLAVTAGLLALPAMASAATVSGTAFEDFNDNGERNSAPMVDSGVGGITVKAYRSDGTEVASTTTAADGSYTLNVPDGTGEVRVEFTDLPAGYQPARHGTNSGTTVQFVNGSASNVDVGVLQPFDYCQNNPQLAVACMQFGPHDGVQAANTAIRLVADGTPEDTVPDQLGAQGKIPGEVKGATYAQVGAVFGLVQPTGSNFLYSASYTKRHTDYGPGGAGAIYRTNIDQANAGTPNASVFFDVNDLPGDPAGNVTRHVNNVDANAYDAVGKSGLGNVTTNLDGSEMYTVGLATRQLIRIPVPGDGSSPSVGSVSAHDIPSPCTPDGDGRPFAATWHDGLVYVGGVCSRESVGNPPNPAVPGTGLSVYVYTFDPATGTFSTAPVLNTPLEGDRLCTNRGEQSMFPDNFCSDGTPANETRVAADWHPWTSDVIKTFSYPQPMLTDIQFVGNDMALGVRDRWPDMIGANSGWPDGDTNPLEATAQAGYTLRACLTGSGYQLEDNGTCGGLTASGQKNVEDWGPGGSLFYWEQDYNHVPAGVYQGAHDYTGLGGLLQIPGYPELRETAMDVVDNCPATPPANGPEWPSCPNAAGPSTAAGVLYLNNNDGSRAKGFDLYSGAGVPGEVSQTFAKANGLGDLEALCEAAPIEIGNYVWIDPDRDGVQDPGETKLGGVKVELLDAGGSVVATTTTDASGQYYFNESNVPGAIQPNTTYTVRIPLDQAVLEPYIPTPHDTSPQLRDSDGVPAGRFVVDRLTTGAAGHNDHTHDFGFTPRVWDQKISKVASDQRVRLGEELTYTLTVENAGPDTSNAGGVVRDAVPAQFDVLDVTAGAGATCKVDDRDVRCELGAMTAGQKIEVKVRAKAIRAGGTVNVAFLEECCNKPPEPTPPVPVQVVKPKLGLTKGANKKVLRAGQKVTYTIRVRNPSDATLRNVRTCDDLPKGLAYVSSSPKAKLSKGKYCWTAKQLRAGQRKTYKLTVRALQGIRPGKKVNHATAKSPDAKTKRAKRTVRVRGAQVAAGGVTG